MNEKEIVVDSEKIVGLSPEVKIEIIRRALTQLDCGEQDIAERHYTAILRLSDDAKVQLPNQITAHKQGGKIVFEKPQPARSIAAEPVALKVPGVTQFGPYTINADIIEIGHDDLADFKKTKTNFVEWFDFEKVKPPLEVRHRKQGDKFWPLGLAGEKKVGKFLTTTKVSQSLRRRLLIVTDKDKIIWLCPVRISEQAKVSNDTRKVIQIKISESVG